jgi:hypothetical protein
MNDKQKVILNVCKKNLGPSVNGPVSDYKVVFILNN